MFLCQGALQNNLPGSYVESLGHLLVVHVDISGGEEEEMYNLKRMIF